MKYDHRCENTEKVKLLKAKLDAKLKGSPSKKAAHPSISALFSPVAKSSQKLSSTHSSPCKKIPLNRDPSPFKKSSFHASCLTPKPFPKKNKNTPEMPPASKRQRSPSTEKKRKKTIKLPYNLGADVYRIFPAQAQRASNNGNQIKELRYLLSISQFADKDVEVPQNFPGAKRVLTVIRTGSGCGGHGI